MLRAVRGPIWLTQTGGFVKYKRWAYSERRADRATRQALSIAHSGGRRIPRLYLYHSAWLPPEQVGHGPARLRRNAATGLWTLAAARGKTVAARSAVGL